MEEQKRKINILFVLSDTHGVGHFRGIWVAQAIELYNKEEFHVEINSQPNVEDFEYLKKFDIIHFHRGLGPTHLEEQTFDFLKKNNIITIMDIDDYWHVPTTHPLYLLIKKEKYPERIQKTLGLADYITTTTEIFAEEIRKINPNVFVIPNAVNPRDKSWNFPETTNEYDKRCKIAWIGGSSHGADIQLMEHSFELLYKNEEIKDNFQIILAGFDTRGTLTQIDEANGKQSQRAILPKETVWYNTFERVFTSNYKGLSDNQEYIEWLNKFDKKSYKDEYNQKYVRRWTKPLTTYMAQYENINVLLAPLCDTDTITTERGQIIKQVNMFNKVKSELKIIEAGMKRKALIAQNFGIYQNLLTDGENALLIDVNKNDKGWYQAMRKLILDPGLVEKLSDNLHNFVKDKYDIKNVTKSRVAFYKDVLKKAKKGNGLTILTGELQKFK